MIALNCPMAPLPQEIPRETSLLYRGSLRNVRDDASRRDIVSDSEATVRHNMRAAAGELQSVLSSRVKKVVGSRRVEGFSLVLYLVSRQDVHPQGQ